MEVWSVCVGLQHKLPSFAWVVGVLAGVCFPSPVAILREDQPQQVLRKSPDARLDGVPCVGAKAHLDDLKGWCGR